MHLVGAYMAQLRCGPDVLSCACLNINSIHTTVIIHHTMSEFDELLNPKILSSPVSSNLPSPPGYGVAGAKKVAAGKGAPGDEQVSQLKLKKAWELAMGPAKSIPLNCIMSYMTGNSLQIIPVTMTLMLLWNPIKAIFNETNSTFKNLVTKENESQILLAKVVFVICQLGSMSVGVYKLYKMGLIPHSEADWLAWKEIVNIRERLSF